MNLLLALVLAPAFAADLCGKYMPCGAWVGQVVNYDQAGTAFETGWTETLTIAPGQGEKLALEDAMTDADDKDAYRLKIELAFTDDGRYTFTTPEGELFAAGVCKHSVCTFDFVPWTWEDGELSGSTGNVNILRFRADGAERTMLATSQPGKHSLQKTVFTRK